MFTAFVDLKKAYDSVQHPLLWASLQRKGVHGKMLAAIQSLYDGGTMSMKISGKSGATGTAQVGVRQGCPLSPTLFGIFFDDLYSQLQSDCPLAGIECRGIRVPGLFYADDVALLSASAEGLQQLLDTMQAFCVANGLTISIPKTEVVVFGGGYHVCTWRVAGHVLQRSQSFTYLGMLFHEDRNIKHAIQSRFSKACGAVGSIFSRYANLECANSVQLLMRLQQAILQPCASYGCEVWAPAAAAQGPLKQLQSLQHSFLRRACRVKKSVPIDIIFEELSVPRWHDFWWRRVLAFWTGLVQADASSICSHVLHDSVALAHDGCRFGWAALVFKCFRDHGKDIPITAGVPVRIHSHDLLAAFKHERTVTFDAMPSDPRLCPTDGVKVCTYHRWFSRPPGRACPTYWDVPIGNAKLHRLLRFRMGAHMLPIEQGRHVRLPRSRRVCRLCRTGALGDERHMLLECSALAGLRQQYSALMSECSGVMARLVWAEDQPLVSRYIIACLDKMSC